MGNSCLVQNNSVWHLLHVHKALHVRKCQQPLTNLLVLHSFVVTPINHKASNQYLQIFHTLTRAYIFQSF